MSAELPGNEWAYRQFRHGLINLGEFGEAVWSRVLLDSGLLYVPLKDLPTSNGKGPRMPGCDQTFPDFDVVHGRRRVYLDSKCKTKSVLFRKANEERIGVDRRHWQSYLALSEIAVQRCALGIVELFRYDGDWSGSLLLQTLGTLGTPIDGFSNQAHMVYWPRTTFSVMAEGISPHELYLLSQGGFSTPSLVSTRLVEFFSHREPVQMRLIR